MIPLIKLPTNKDDAKAVADVVMGKNIGLGEKVFEFEKKLAKFAGSKYAVALDSCTSALFLSVKYITEEVGGWGIVIGIPSMTVPLVANAIMEARARLVFTDDIDWVGTSYNLQGTNIYDSAHELYRGCFKKYPKGSTVCLSFYPTKPLGSADGGAILTDDKAFADWVRSISCYGRNQKSKYQNSWEYEVEMVGYKRHYTNLQAALCMSQLSRLDNTNKVRGVIRDAYNEAFGLNNTSDYLYRLFIPKRDAFVKHMKKNGMTCGVHYKPMHMMKAYDDISLVGDVEKVVKGYNETVSIPFYAGMLSEEIVKVIKFTKEWLEQNQRSDK